MGSIPNRVDASSSRTKKSFKSALFSSEPSFLKTSVSCPTLDITISAVKFCPVSASSINTARTSSNLKVSILDIVKSAFDEFSISLPVSALSDAISFSPT